MMWIWKYDKRTDDSKIILNCVRKLMKDKEKEARKGSNLIKHICVKMKLIHSAVSNVKA